MYFFVDQNDQIMSRAKYELTSVPKQTTWRNLKYANVNQNFKFIASYWIWSENILFWKNKKKINRIQTKKGIDSVVLSNQFTAVLIGDNLYMYYNKNRLITKTNNIMFLKQITFTIHKQVIFKSQESVQIYDFVRKSLTICDNSYTANKYEYCPINDIILIPQGDKFTEYISVWSVKQNQIIREVYTGWLKEFRIKMAKSGKYFIVSAYRQAGLNIYSYGDQITCIRKIKNVKPYQEIQWVLDDNYLLIHSYIQYQLLQIDNEQILDCKIEKMEDNPSNFVQAIDKQNKQIYILIKIQGHLAHYFSIYL